VDGWDQHAAQICEEQAGLVRRAQLLDLGCSPNDIARRAAPLRHPQP
jgi:hypothetical protein